MHHVERSNTPGILIEKQHIWTKPWLDHYYHGSRPKKPSSSHWLRDDIRIPLISDFSQNCGYCGCSVPSLKEKNNNESIGKGDVDHFLPKSKFPQKVYNWSNLIWSCKACNTEKWNHVPFLNPCNKDHCDMLGFISEKGEYYLKDEFKDEEGLALRFSNNDKRTFLNSEEICRQRQVLVSSLRNRFESVHTFLYLGDDLPAVCIPLMEQCLLEIKEIIAQPSFKLILQWQYQLLLIEFDAVAEKIHNQ